MLLITLFIIIFGCVFLDFIYSSGNPDNSVESMMSLFGTPSSLHTPTNPPPLQIPGHPSSLRAPASLPPHSHSHQLLHSSASKIHRKSHPSLPHLSLGNVPGLKTSMPRPTMTPSSASGSNNQPSNIKVSLCLDLMSTP